MDTPVYYLFVFLFGLAPLEILYLLEFFNGVNIYKMFQILLLIIFLTGLVVGSFLNCLIYRLETKGSFLRGRSFCPHCKHVLSWPDLIPLLSFFMLRGKCRYCRQKISWQYPIVEIATGVLFILVILNVVKDPLVPALSTGFLASLGMTIFLFIISSFLIIIFIYDLKYYIIPDKIIYPAILIVLVFRAWDLIGYWDLGFGILKPFLSAFGAAIFFLMVVLISRGKWMGVGDIKLAFFMGLFLGFPNILVALFIAFSIGAIIGVGLVLLKRKTLKSEVPFGPFLVTGTFIALLWGEKIIQRYLNLFIC